MNRDLARVVSSYSASRSFLSKELIRVLVILMNLPTKVQMMLGNGKTTRGQGMNCGVPFTILWVKVIIDFLQFQLGVLDLTLGFSWVTSLGWVHIHWDKL